MRRLVGARVQAAQFRLRQQRTGKMSDCLSETSLDRPDARRGHIRRRRMLVLSKHYQHIMTISATHSLRIRYTLVWW